MVDVNRRIANLLETRVERNIIHLKIYFLFIKNMIPFMLRFTYNRSKNIVFLYISFILEEDINTSPEKNNVYLVPIAPSTASLVIQLHS